MAIPSTSFFYFFAVFICLYYSLPKNWQNPLLLLASYLFYASWQPGYLLLLLGGSLVTYLVQLKLDGKGKKAWLVLGLTYHVGILLLFKYFNFFSRSLAALVEALGGVYAPLELKWLLPIGISFYSFEAISLLMDRYRGKLSGTSLMDTALYLGFFPTVLSGPIKRMGAVRGQFRTPRDFDWLGVKEGFYLFVLGACKKLAIANVLAKMIEGVFEQPEAYFGLPLIFTAFFFTWQIYYDFSGYSDMARGMAKMLGFDILDNFKKPYGARSMPEFWRRWHISLSTWFRDYLYIPLGGSRVPRARFWLNQLVVMGVSGLWHGAAGHFIVWGLYHGILMILSDIKTSLKGKGEPGVLRGLVSQAWTFVLASVGWVLFRAHSLGDALIFYRQALVAGDLGLGAFFYEIGLTDLRALMVFGTMVLVTLLGYLAQEEKVEVYLMKRPFPLRLVLLYMLLFAAFLFGGYGYEETTQFIYFQF